MTTDNPTQLENKLEPPEALARASKLCRSTIPGARVELIFQNLQDAQAVHKWLCNLNTPAATPTPVEQERGLWNEAASIVQACLNVHSTYSDAEREFAAHLIEVFNTRDQHPNYKHRNTVRAYPAATPAPVVEQPLDDVSLRGSVEITVFRGDKILAVNSRNFGGFCGVGGKVEQGETFEQAARRELMEETGCEALSMQFVAGHTLDPIPGDDQSVKWYCAGFVVDIGSQEPRQNEEGTVPFWTTKENMIQNSLFPVWYSWWFGVLEGLAIPSPSLAAREAAEEVSSTFGLKLQEDSLQRCAWIVSKHCSPVPAAGGDEDRMRWLLTRIIHDLPQRHDWLDPDLEREARTYMK